MKNTSIPKIKPKMDISFDIKPKTKFVNNLDAIEIKLLNYTRVDDLNNFVADWSNATWNKYPYESTDNGDYDAAKYINGSINGIVLPTLLETINLTFLLNGIDLTTVTHILRYRTASFSADCSADKLWHERTSLVPSAVQNSTEIYQKYMKATELCKEVYCDIINSKEIGIMDARSILPRNLTTFYYMNISLKDVIHFIRQRIDKQIQPEVDNIIAYKMYLEILRVYPFLKGMIDVKAPAMHFIKQANTTGSTNLYWPDEDSDIFDWNPESFVYQRERKTLNGTNEGAENHFEQLKFELWKEIEKV